MGQKVNPHGLRVGIIKDWDSRWYAKNELVGDLLVEDHKIREYLKKTLYSAGVPKIEIERDNAKVRIYLHCAKPGVVIGKGGAEIERVRKLCDQMINKGKAAADRKQVFINVVEVKSPDKNAQLVAESIAAQLEGRVSFRRAMKQSMGRAMRMGALGIKTCCSGRLGGRTIRYAEHARYRNCDGVFIANESYKKPEVRELADCGIPAVTIDYTYDGCASVQSDNYQGVRDLVRYIHGMGHRRIAFIHGEDTPVTDVRVASFRQTCRELGLDIPEAYVTEAVYCDPASCEAPTRRLLALETPPTCILYPDDTAYIGGRNEIYRQGLRIPEDISAAGYDGIDLSQILRPRLTTLK